MQLIIRIEIGNDAMSKSKHVADALRGIAARIENCAYLETEVSFPLVRGVTDVNGNTVGEWKIE